MNMLLITVGIITVLVSLYFCYEQSIHESTIRTLRNRYGPTAKLVEGIYRGKQIIIVEQTTEIPTEFLHTIYTRKGVYLGKPSNNFWKVVSFARS